MTKSSLMSSGSAKTFCARFALAFEWMLICCSRDSTSVDFISVSMLLSPLLLDGGVVAAVACGVVPAGLGVEAAAAPDCEVLLQAPIDCASLLRRAFIFFMKVILPVCCGVRQDSQLQRNQPVFPLSPL